jgi:hypothetical protein
MKVLPDNKRFRKGIRLFGDSVKRPRSDDAVPPAAMQCDAVQLRRNVDCTAEWRKSSTAIIVCIQPKQHFLSAYEIFLIIPVKYVVSSSRFPSLWVAKSMWLMMSVIGHSQAALWHAQLGNWTVYPTQQLKVWPGLKCFCCYGGCLNCSDTSAPFCSKIAGLSKGKQMYSLYTGCVSESGDFKNVTNSKCFHLYSFTTYEHPVYINAFKFF